VSIVRLTVPGNILLLGEYAVLEDGGLGLAMAVEPRVRLEASPAESLFIQSEWPGASVSWTPEHPDGSALISAVVDAVAEYLGRRPGARVRMDSSDLFSAGGRKAGLGSSAAASVALACGLLHASGADSAAHGPEARSLALKAHRRAQGGRGSGYDVVASFHGGAGIFKGGVDPAWQPSAVPGGLGVVLFPGPGPVSTADAVGRYEDWKTRNPREARDFLRESNNAVLSFMKAGYEEQARLWFDACRELGIELGASIGVPADASVPPDLDPNWCKALGAGNELGLCLLPPDVDAPKGFQHVRPADTGVKWEE
jgi:phosphomevalonate kinase